MIALHPPAGDDERLATFERITLPHLDDLARFAAWVAGDPDLAADLVQETYLKALRSWHQFTPGSDVRAWLMTICRNTHRSGQRRAWRNEAVDAPELEALASAEVFRSAVAAGLDATFGSFDLKDAVQRELRALPGSFREAVALVDLEGFSYEEAARVMAVPVGTVRSRLFRGRRLLQERLLIHARDAGFDAVLAHSPDRSGRHDD